MVDWNRLNPARNLSIFKIEPDLLREMGIDDEELPVTVDDRAINIIPMGDEDDDSVAGRMTRAVFQDEQADAPAIIQDTQALRVREANIQDTQELRASEAQTREEREEDEEQADAQREQKAQKLENE
jgi:hypothetical protein